VARTVDCLRTAQQAVSQAERAEGWPRGPGLARRRWALPAVAGPAAGLPPSRLPAFAGHAPARPGQVRRRPCLLPAAGGTYGRQPPSGPKAQRAVGPPPSGRRALPAAAGPAAPIGGFQWSRARPSGPKAQRPWPSRRARRLPAGPNAQRAVSHQQAALPTARRQWHARLPRLECSLRLQRRLHTDLQAR
jgi:hypothetical protein